MDSRWAKDFEPSRSPSCDQGGVSIHRVFTYTVVGANGTTTALIMLVIVLAANGLLQNVVQPFAMGSALDLNPLVVLVITTGAGCIFGMLGLILAAPLTSAAVHIMRDLARARLTAAAKEEAGAPVVEPPPAATAPA